MQRAPGSGPVKRLWPFKSVCGPAWGSWGLEMTVVRAEDSGEQPGSRFDVTLGLGFSGFQDWPLGSLRGMKLGQELGGGRAQLRPRVGALQARLCLLRQLRLAEPLPSPSQRHRPARPRFPRLECGAEPRPPCPGSSSRSPRWGGRARRRALPDGITAWSRIGGVLRARVPHLRLDHVGVRGPVSQGPSRKMGVPPRTEVRTKRPRVVGSWSPALGSLPCSPQQPLRFEDR